MIRPVMGLCCGAPEPAVSKALKDEATIRMHMKCCANGLLLVAKSKAPFIRKRSYYGHKEPHVSRSLSCSAFHEGCHICRPWSIHDCQALPRLCAGCFSMARFLCMGLYGYWADRRSYKEVFMASLGPGAQIREVLATEDCRRNCVKAEAVVSSDRLQSTCFQAATKGLCPCEPAVCCSCKPGHVGAAGCQSRAGCNSSAVGCDPSAPRQRTRLEHAVNRGRLAVRFIARNTSLDDRTHYMGVYVLVSNTLTLAGPALNLFIVWLPRFEINLGPLKLALRLHMTACVSMSVLKTVAS